MHTLPWASWSYHESTILGDKGITYGILHGIKKERLANEGAGQWSSLETGNMMAVPHKLELGFSRDGTE